MQITRTCAKRICVYSPLCFLQRAAEAAQVGASPTSPVGGHSNGSMQASTSPPNPNTSPKGGEGQVTSRGSHSTPHIEQNTTQAVRTSSPPVEQQTNNLPHQLSALRRPASPTYTTLSRSTHWAETPTAASAYPPIQTSPRAAASLPPAAKDDLLHDWMLSPAGKLLMETKEGQAWPKTKNGVEWQKQKKKDEREEAEPGGYCLRDQQGAFSVLQQKVRAQQDEIDKLKVCVCACARVLHGCWG